MLIVKGTNVWNLQSVIADAKRKDFITTAFILLILIDVGSAIKCFRCEVSRSQHYENNELVTMESCKKMNNSHKYIFDCPYSSMCVKRISTFLLNNGTKREAITRNCAMQRMSKDVFRNGEWEIDYFIQEVYTEGCQKDTDNAAITHCYCSKDLCNSSHRLHIDVMFFVYYLPILPVILFKMLL